jgi:hypothetical protein
MPSSGEPHTVVDDFCKTLACADKDSTGRTHTYAFVTPNYFLAPSRPGEIIYATFSSSKSQSVSMDSQEDVKSSKAEIVAARMGVLLFSALQCHCGVQKS